MMLLCTFSHTLTCWYETLVDCKTITIIDRKTTLCSTTTSTTSGTITAAAFIIIAFTSITRNFYISMQLSQFTDAVTLYGQ